ncbi:MULTISPECIES: ISL3 family transposase [Gemella]|uniref:ISL3 family transposase n=1 Tax=Gemella TaxID=1378 RepID=UPI0007680C46|nr:MULTISPECIES: ISL3 family transposase [Gemella]AME09298.1 hypothetical protein AXE85_03610 [Gemella sp. oral taxon 928]
MPINILELLNFKEKRLKLYHSEKVKEDNKQVNYIYGNISYVPKRCPKCKEIKLLKNGTDTVKLQILNICGIKSYLILEKQRILCTKCNYCFSVRFKDCKKHCRKVRVVSNIVDYQLARTKNSLNDIANSNEISTSYVQKQISRYKKNIKVRKDTLPKVLGIDEINGVKTYQGKYNCLIYDIEKRKVKDFLITRRKQYLDNYFSNYTEEAKEQVKYFVTDMWDTYISSGKKHFKNAKIIIDRFHIIKLAIETLNKIRIEVMNKYKVTDFNYRVLYRFRNLIKLKSEKITTNYRKYRGYNFYSDYDVIKYILSLSEELEEAYYLMQAVVEIFDKKNEKKLDEIFQNTNISHWKIKSTIKTYIKYQEYIINSIKYPYSNGVVEAANRNIKRLKNNACGYRNFQNFRTRIFMIFNYLSEEKVKNSKKVPKTIRAG